MKICTGIIQLVCLLLVSSTGRAQFMYTVDLHAAPVAIRTGHLKLGTHVNPSGESLGANNFYFTRNNKPWYPVMGEFHFSRYPREQWEESILKMKAAGITVIVSYIFWIHHEEEEGAFDWTGNRNLREFVALCKKHQVYFFARIGPWCHGEARNGGFPDWIVQRGHVRKNDVAYLRSVKRLYDEIGKQLHGFYFKDGGPVIGAQIENEYRFSNEAGFEHLLTLKKLAIEAGMDVPYYTATGWPGSNQKQAELIPVWGAYPEAPWDSRTIRLPLLDSYLFGSLRNDPAIGNDILGKQEETIVDLKGYPYPYATAEMGGGNQITYHRRPVIQADDVTALSYVKIGSGANLIGYYMFHGGSNPIGKLSTMQESKATKYGNDYPIISYDFYAPIGEWGQLRPSYRGFKVLHSFLNEFGDSLAQYDPAFPDQAPANPADDTTLRMAVRSKDNRGFIFISNFQRQLDMKDLTNVQFTLKCSNNTTLVFPSKPITIKRSAQMILPFNMDLMSATLQYATAQPLCRLGDSIYVFFAPEGMDPEFVFEKTGIQQINTKATVEEAGNRYVINKVQPGANSCMQLKLNTGRIITMITLTHAQALNAWKVKEKGKEYIIISEADIEDDEKGIRVKSTGATQVRLNIFPEVNGHFSTGKVQRSTEGIFTHYHVTFPEAHIKVAFSAIKNTDAYRHYVQLPLDDRLAQPDSTSPGPQYQTRWQMLPGARTWKINLQPGYLKGLNDAFINIDYTGDTGAAYAEGDLIADDFYAGLPMTIGMKRFKGKLTNILFQVVPLTDTRNIYFEKGIREPLKEKTVAHVKNVSIVPQYVTTLTFH